MKYRLIAALKIPLRRRRIRGCFRACLVAVLGSCLFGGNLLAEENVGIHVPPGFEVSLYADDDLAHDIYSMTVDSLGRVVVSGAGYVRILIDKDGDGKADSFKQFVDGPKSGAQGMAFHGRDLLCTGDDGLIRYRDRDGDDRADGSPDVFLKIKAGSEHHAHAIQRGPDGWWFLIAGNMAEVTGKYATLSTSPIRKPAYGTLLRFQPDLAGGEIVADGFRNAYDFAFHSAGDLFVFDSDGERDVSLPWYRPTRVFHALPGSNAGWVSRSWKRPDYFPDMPPVVAEFGRGSPTGVTCYRHRQFPEKFQGALFVLDWTFGRVMALPLQKAGSSWSSKPIEFMSGIGQFGFAPTDVVVSPDGSLLVCVGGRGTRGSVYRVRYTGKDNRGQDNTTAKTGENQSAGSSLSTCLNAPQPLSSWSRAKWLPLARRLGRQRFVDAAKDKTLSIVARLRAIEILTDLYGGVDTITLLKLATTEAVEIRARAVWSAGRSGLIARQPKLLLPFFNDADPLVVRCALETLLGNPKAESQVPLFSSLARQLGAEDRFVRQTAARVVSQLPDREATQLKTLAGDQGVQAELAYHLGRVTRAKEFNADTLAVGLNVLKGDHPRDISLQAVRLLQLSLGDVGPRDKQSPAFDSYASWIDLTEYKATLEPVAVELASIYPTGNKQVDVELSRVLAMLAPADADLLDRVLAKIDERSHPVDDIHQLLVAARIPAQRTERQREAIAAALVTLDTKMTARKLKLDGNWDPRIGEMYAELTKHDPALPQAIVKRPEFGRPGQVIYLSQLSKDDLPTVVSAFAQSVQGDRDYPWNNQIVFLLGASKTPAHRALVRNQYESFAVRGAVLIVLAKKPEVEDRDKFVEGLSSSQLGVLEACLNALLKLPENLESTEQFALLRTLRRLGSNRSEYELREKVVKLLRRNLKQDFEFILGTAGHKPQPDVIRKWTDYLSSQFPDVSVRELGGGAADLSQLKIRLAEVDWSKGDAARGRALFQKRSCVQCHGGRQALGPDLAGVARRFSRDDLFVSIVIPNRDVSPRYQTTLVETTEGKVYTGLIIYESVEGLLLRNATNQTYRFEADEIETRQTRPTSLMPSGLLKDLKPGELADLYRYIGGL
jgi:putative membrane-bound dehydrogenase-like protein